LEKQYRQAKDQDYTDILNGIRKGFLTRRQLEALRARARAIDDPFATRTRLLTINVDVDNVNHAQLEELDGEVYEYEMETSGAKKYVEQLKKSCLAPEVLRLKRGAAVMCIKNAPDRKYVNGSLGTVIDFEKGSDLPIVELVNGRIITIKPESWELMDGDKRRASLVQLPLRLAWAITVHKSQGMTLDAARIDLSRAFVEGMGYVALSPSAASSTLFWMASTAWRCASAPLPNKSTPSCAPKVNVRAKFSAHISNNGKLTKQAACTNSKWKIGRGQQPRQKNYRRLILYSSKNCASGAISWRKKRQPHLSSSPTTPTSRQLPVSNPKH
ncbi:hypothetical protein IRY61_04490, partial [Candidatus Saccharibacteria bacterium]|nr:hypothetical protein [Candidatus Saccharibacteria bacterium]